MISTTYCQNLKYNLPLALTHQKSLLLRSPNCQHVMFYSLNSLAEFNNHTAMKRPPLQPMDLSDPPCFCDSQPYNQEHLHGSVVNSPTVPSESPRWRIAFGNNKKPRLHLLNQPNIGKLATRSVFVTPKHNSLLKMPLKG